MRQVRARAVVRHVQSAGFEHGFVFLGSLVGARWPESLEGASRMRVVRVVCSWVGDRVPVPIAAYVTSTMVSISGVGAGASGRPVAILRAV